MLGITLDQETLDLLYPRELSNEDNNALDAVDEWVLAEYEAKPPRHEGIELSPRIKK